MDMIPTQNTSVIGASLPRIDGPLKVSGAAKYASDHFLPRMVYAVPVCSTIANGSVVNLDLAAADSMPGVIAIYHKGNIGSLYRTEPATGIDGHIDEKRPPFEDDAIHYYGQYVAAVVAETFEQAEAAAHAVKVTYKTEKPDVTTDLSSAHDELKAESERGNVAQAWASAAHKVDATYSTPAETHNPIELHATVASWDGQKLLVHESTQAVVNHRIVVAQMFGIPVENVQVISRFLGSGFGGKLWPWTHALIAVAAARNLNRPVKLVISRKMMFQTVGHRPRTQQQIQLSASPDGKLTSLHQQFRNHTSILDDYKEDCGEATGFLYSTPNLRVASGLVRRNVGTPTSMRGPGAVPGLFALESAMDELAIELKMDPLELRLRNEPEKDESKNIPFSSRHLKECLTVGAQKFGWSKRNAEVGSMRNGSTVLGWGMAACTWIAERLPCEASVTLKSDGTARVACATQDIGTGTYTILAQLVAAKTGIAMGKIEVALGDTDLPAGPLSGGSMATASVIPAVSEATAKAIQVILMAAGKGDASTLKGKQPDALAFSNGLVHANDAAPETGVPFAEILKHANIAAASGSGKSEGTFLAKEPKFSMHSYGAHFVEVGWQPEIARLRVNRTVTVIDAGRILNKRAGLNQIEGAIVMGVGMGLFEHTHYDPRNGAPINSNLADYIVASHADTPEIDVTFLDYPDTALNELGARGIGEIGMAGVAAAITSAVHHATGVRVRDLPVHIEDLLPRNA